ncbi:MAG: hypothetical protein HY337_11480, partial [Gemmatimonadetes bacterium]|nr:hypothetical protein [Gemmatimonadota bacterium]
MSDLRATAREAADRIEAVERRGLNAVLAFDRDTLLAQAEAAARRQQGRL